MMQGQHIQVSDSRAAALYRIDACKPRCQRQREESNSGIKVDSMIAGLAADDFFHQLLNEKSIHLEEGSVADSKVMANGLISDGSGRKGLPLCSEGFSSAWN